MLKIKFNEDICVGLERNIDALGRVVIPMEMRKQLRFGENQKVSIQLYNNHVLIKKAEEVCCFCGSKTDLINYKGILICHNCISDLLDKLE